VTPGRAARGAALAGLVALSGCGWFSSSAPEKTTQGCPGAVILRPLANTAVFGPGPDRRPENVAFYGLLSEIESSCTISAQSVLMKLDVIVIAQRGQVGKGNTVDLDYFVAVTAPQQTILDKKPFRVRIVFNPNQIRAGVTDHIEVAIPLAGRTPADLTLDLGFQQPPDVVDFYKRFRGRTGGSRETE
jgi:hypothetical protein